MKENYSSDLIQLKKEINKLKWQNRLFMYFFALLLTSFIGYSFVDVSEKKLTTLRLKQLIVEDSNGNDRIIISADISKSKSRVRKDTLGGILILNEHGKDQLILGHSKTVQFKGKILPRTMGEIPYGFWVNDSIGDERAGIGYYNKRQLAAMGLDNSAGEGVHLLAAEKNLYDMVSGIFVQKRGGGGYLFAGETKNKRMTLYLRSAKEKTEFYMDSLNTAIATKNLKNDSVKVLLKAN